MFACLLLRKLSFSKSVGRHGLSVCLCVCVRSTGRNFIDIDFKFHVQIGFGRRKSPDSLFDDPDPDPDTGFFLNFAYHCEIGRFSTFSLISRPIMAALGS